MDSKAHSAARPGKRAVNGSRSPRSATLKPRGSTPVLSSSSGSESGDAEPMASPTRGKSLASPLDAESHFNSLQSYKSRTASVYSLSRISLSSQLSQLTSLALPDPTTLGSSLSAIPTAPAAASTLSNAAEQIRQWLQKATEVLSGLDAEDDVEWAAAGGREGLSDVDEAIGKFEGLITVYVTAIEELQEREDVAKVPADQLNGHVDQMESILKDWDGVKRSLREIKYQVELAMEWEELWNNVLGDINMELENLARLVFEMEEARHRAVATGFDSNQSLDLKELDTIAEEAPAATAMSSADIAKNLGLFSANQPSPPTSPHMGVANDDSRLLALFARMQPLRAALDFLPMTLSSFRVRAGTFLPSACNELDIRKKSLEARWTTLERDAQGLRQELGEDRWVLVFRNAGRQAQKLCESVERSIAKVQEAIDVGLQHGNPPLLAKKVEAYEAKKSHYAPAIRKVLGIIEKGVTDRQTVNGEILRVHSDTKTRWQDLEQDIKNMDLALDDIHMNKNQQLRDSISSILSIDRSANGSATDTPGSSPASSVIMGPAAGFKRDSSPGMHGSGHRSSSSIGLQTRSASSRRHFSMPPGSFSGANLPRKSTTTRAVSSDVTTGRAASPASYRPPSNLSTATRTPRSASAKVDSRPRWNSSSRVDHSDYSSKPRPYLYQSPTLARKSSNSNVRGSQATPSSIPTSSPLGRSSPAPSATSTNRALVHRSRHSTGATSTSSSLRQSSLAPSASHRTPPSSSHSNRQGLGLDLGPETPSGSTNKQASPTVRMSRPPSSMGGGNRISMIPLPKNPTTPVNPSTARREPETG